MLAFDEVLDFEWIILLLVMFMLLPNSSLSIIATKDYDEYDDNDVE